jgi:hypothetical protein
MNVACFMWLNDARCMSSFVEALLPVFSMTAATALLHVHVHLVGSIMVIKHSYCNVGNHRVGGTSTTRSLP